MKKGFWLTRPVFRGNLLSRVVDNAKGEFVLATIFTTLAYVLFLVAPMAYVIGMHRGKITPNPTTWFIWALTQVINVLFSRKVTSEGHRFLDHFPMLAAVVLVAVFLEVYRRFGKGTWGWSERWALGATMCVLATCFLFRQHPHVAEMGTTLMQIPMLVGFGPTYVGIWKGTEVERWPAWTFGISAYVFQVTALAVTEGTRPAQYAWPIFNGIIGNGIVLLLIYFIQRPRERRNN